MRRDRAGPLRVMAVVAVLTVLSACGALGVQPVDQWGERLGAAYLTVSGLRDTGLRLLQAGMIDDREAADVQRQADQLRATLDTVRAVRSTNAVTADQQLQAVLKSAQIVVDCMAERENAPPPTGDEVRVPLAVCIQKRDPPI